MAKLITIIVLQVHMAVCAGTTKKESDLLPFGSTAKACSVVVAGVVTPQISEGDLMIIRVDVSHLMHDPKVPAYDIQRLSSPYNYFQTHFSDPNAIKL